MAEAEVALDADARNWSLAALADEAEFDGHIEATASAIADRFTLRAHINVSERKLAFQDWIDRVRAEDRRPLDYSAFVNVCAGMIAAVGARRVVSYSAMMRTPGEMVTDTVLQYGNEITAFAAGAAVYVPIVEDITGEPASEPLSTLVVGNAAAAFRRHPEAALRFRELLRLATPQG